MRPFVLALTLSLFGACAVEPDPAADLFGDDQGATLAEEAPDALPDGELPPPPVITMAGTCPGPVTFTVTGLTPASSWRLARSPILAPGVPIPGMVCPGQWMRIGPPTTWSGPLPAGPLGVFSTTVTLPPALCGTYIQALDVASCSTSMYLQL